MTDYKKWPPATFAKVGWAFVLGLALLSMKGWGLWLLLFFGTYLLVGLTKMARLDPQKIFNEPSILIVGITTVWPLVLQSDWFNK